jgi:hypothetical protein
MSSSIRSPLQRMPADLHDVILQFCDLETLVQLRRVCVCFRVQLNGRRKYISMLIRRGLNCYEFDVDLFCKALHASCGVLTNPQVEWLATDHGSYYLHVFLVDVRPIEHFLANSHYRRLSCVRATRAVSAFEQAVTHEGCIPRVVYLYAIPPDADDAVFDGVRAYIPLRHRNQTP